MRHVINNRYRGFAVLLLALFWAGSCSKSDLPEGPGAVTGAEADSINRIIEDLSYNPEVLLNVQSNPGKFETRNRVSQDVDQGEVFECRRIDYNLRSNFQDVVMFDPTIGVVYPGALVVGNRDMLDGSPQPLQISKAPTKIRVELPGIGARGNITVDNPNYQNTQARIDEVLEYWNAEVAPQGYAIDADSYFEKTTAYSREQMSLELGVSAEWAGGSSFDSQFDYTQTTEKRVASLLYRQVYYDVVMETPDSPASVFGRDVDAATVRSVISDDSPPAYVSSVQYGRIIMIRMETSDTSTEANLEAVLDYATKAKSATVDVNATYDRIIKQSTFNVVTIGGNAQTATEVITGSSVEDGEGGLHYVIAQGSLYSRENPGAPIGYTIKYLKDNRIARMGYNTDYQIESCRNFDYVHENVNIKRTSGPRVRFRFKYKRKKSNTFVYDPSWRELSDSNVFFSRTPEKGAHDVYVQFQVWDIVWKTWDEVRLNYISSDICWETYCSDRFAGICTELSRRTTSCN